MNVPCGELCQLFGLDPHLAVRVLLVVRIRHPELPEEGARREQVARVLHAVDGELVLRAREVQHLGAVDAHRRLVRHEARVIVKAVEEVHLRRGLRLHLHERSRDRFRASGGVVLTVDEDLAARRRGAHLGQSDVRLVRRGAVVRLRGIDVRSREHALVGTASGQSLDHQHCRLGDPRPGQCGRRVVALVVGVVEASSCRRPAHRAKSAGTRSGTKSASRVVSSAPGSSRRRSRSRSERGWRARSTPWSSRSRRPRKIPRRRACSTRCRPAGW